MILIKLGGSFITYKKDDCAPPYRCNELSLHYRIREDRLHQVARVMKEHLDEKFILIHGGGTHGHRTVTRYRKLDLRAKDNLRAWEIKWRMEQLTLAISSVMGCEKVPTISIPPGDIMKSDNGSIVDLYPEPLEELLNRDCVPVLRGDLVPDINGGWSVVSGDTIIEEICKKGFSNGIIPSKVIMMMDVEGFMDPDSGKLIGEINSGRFESMKERWESALKSDTGDVSGGIWGKVSTMKRIADLGVEGFIIGKDAKGSLEKVLQGGRAGTRFPPGK